MNRNGTPHETTWTGRPVAVAAAGDNPIAAAAPPGFAIGSPNVGFGCVIQTKLSSFFFQVSDTGTGPMPRPNTKPSRSELMTPARARANVLPIVGWPAIGSSAAGVK